MEGASYDLQKMYRRKEQVVETLRAGVENLIKQNKIELVFGKGVITGENQVRVKDTLYTGERVIIATGSVPARIPIPGADLPLVITSDELLQTPFEKGHLVIIGGGVIGVEFASVYAALGKQVTIIEGAGRILPSLDKEISQNTAMIFKKSGVKIYTGATVTQIEPSGGGALCRFEVKEKEETAQGDAVLLSVGRRGNAQGLFENEILPQMEKGYILADDEGRSSLPWLYAIGDVTGGIQLAHRASAQGIYCVEKALGESSLVNQQAVPGCVYTKPEIATVGLTEEEAQGEGIETYTGKYIMAGNGRTLIEMGDRGFIKLVFDKNTDALLGAHLMCERATDMINELTHGVAQGLTREELLGAMRPHPTFSEGITEALEGAVGKSIHSAPARKGR